MALLLIRATAVPPEALNDWLADLAARREKLPPPRPATAPRCGLQSSRYEA
jgi:hypothetical protein